jgi:hypothetical protein
LNYPLEAPRDRTMLQSIQARNLDELFLEAQRLPRTERPPAIRYPGFRLSGF